MIELMYFSKSGQDKKAYHLQQSRPGEPWEIVDGDELIGILEKEQGLWRLHCLADLPKGMCTELAKLVDAQHFNRLPQDIKTHWPGKVLEVVIVDDAQYLVICQPGTELDSFIKIFTAYTPYLLKDEWPVVFRIYDSAMSEDATVLLCPPKN